MARNRQMLPPLWSAALSYDFTNPDMRPHRLREVIEVTGFHLYDLQFTPNWFQWTQDLGNEVVAIMNGEQPVETGMKRAADAINRWITP
ncbi:MAG: hypothetical protein PHH90_09045 [Limnochordia bacterium]|nr:hypothetical protein [Limnochordia bacterium]